jgi:hypothetical protein
MILKVTANNYADFPGMFGFRRGPQASTSTEAMGDVYPIARRTQKDMKILYPEAELRDFGQDSFGESSDGAFYKTYMPDNLKESNAFSLLQAGLNILLGSSRFTNFFNLERVEHMLRQCRDAFLIHDPSHWPHLTVD